MALLSAPDFAHIFEVHFPVCPCKLNELSRRTDNLNANWNCSFSLLGLHRGKRGRNFGVNLHKKWVIQASVTPTNGRVSNLQVELAKSARWGANNIVLRRFLDELDDPSKVLEDDSVHSSYTFTDSKEDPIVDKLRTQLGVVQSIPSPPINRKVSGLFVLFFFVGVVFDKIWTRLKRKESDTKLGWWRQPPTSFSMFLEKDFQRKESVEWVNMVLGKLWKVYRVGLENWLLGLLQPVLDDIEKPDYVERVEVKQLSLGDEPLVVRSVERRTSRRVNDLQYQIGLRYTGDARMLLMVSMKFGILPVIVPVSVRDFDIDGELWVKLRLIPTEPWVGAVSWAFVSLPKIKFELSLFRLFNLMAIPVLSMFLTKLLTEDLPRLFVLPKKIDLDIQEGKSVWPLPDGFKSGDVQEKNKDFVGELSVTLVDARNLSYVLSGKTDPYVVLRLGDKTIRSKKNSQTSFTGPPGEPIWNQDFNMLVANPRKEKLYIEVVDSLGFANIAIGSGEVDLGSLQDTVPTDKIVILTGGWNLLRKMNSGEVLLRLTYKAYVEDEEEEETKAYVAGTVISDDYKKILEGSVRVTDKESFMDFLAALIVSEEFQGIVASETRNPEVVDHIIPKGLAAESSSSRVGAVPEGSKGSVLFWLAVVTSLALVIAINVCGSSLFTP